MTATPFRWLPILIPATGFLLAILFSLTAWPAPGMPMPWKFPLHAAGIFILISGAGLFSGALLGFLFGFPHSADENYSKSGSLLRYQHSKSIEQISDWVIKMLIGIGLSQMREFPPILWSIAGSLTSGITTIGGPDGATSAAACLIVFFLICGFIEGYLATRLFLPPRLIEADGD